MSDPDEQQEDLPEFDFLDPLKRRRDENGEEERMPGWDPIVPPIPPDN